MIKKIVVSLNFLRKNHVLTDKFGRYHDYLRISLTEKCNLRCKYCMPEEGVLLTANENLLTDNEIIRLVKIFEKNGVSKIRLTGGEPTIRPNLSKLIYDIRCIEGIKSIGITTNGIILSRQLPDLIKSGLTHVNISLDTLDPNKYMILSRRNGFSKVIKSIKLAQNFFPYVKINVVVMRGINDNEVVDFVKMTKNENLYIRFIEYMPFEGNKFDINKMIPYKELLIMIDNEIDGTIIKATDSKNDTSKGYYIDGWKGKFGFISSMSDHFCGTCNRLRITADGSLKVCLHENTEISLRKLLREGSNIDIIENIIEKAVKRKKFKHADVNILKNLKNRPMILIAHRYFSSVLTHFDNKGKISMVDTSSKIPTKRTAMAQAEIYVTKNIMEALLKNELKKGDAECVAQIAGINACKKTSDLIPLCHNISINDVKLKIYKFVNKNKIVILSKVTTTSQTGVEMEALTSVSISALTIYDMLKALDHEMTINNIKLLGKKGGKNDFGIVDFSEYTVES
uniref:Cyclic pyranopterin monophosphate synthase n=1 Tax=Strongyloides stercoralis TaxID=6248 RepID=A0A0K0EHB3_STRER